MGADIMRTPQPTKPIDCFTEEQKAWALERLKEAHPDAWERLVRRQAHNMKLYAPSEEEKSEWLLDSVREGQAIKSFPFEYGDDGWESSRQYVILTAYIDAAVAEAKRRYMKGK
ncbi:hypothetical protein HC762_01335 [bacterium]|nr:hypothetical protein [bacterium]